MGAAALVILRRRSEFLRAAGSGRKWVMPGLILQACRPAPFRENEPMTRSPNAPVLRVGFTASKKVGGAVRRNRAKRRLRALAREVLPVEAVSGHDYVLIARAETACRDFTALKGDLRQALKRLKLARTAAGGTAP